MIGQPALASREHELRSGCRGVMPLSGRLERWQTNLLGDHDALAELLDVHGSPVNVLDAGPLARNAGELSRAAAGCGVELEIFFARKANKALVFVDEARRLGLGVDLASEQELQQVLARDFPPARLVMTAAVKPARLLELCLASGTTVAIDNDDELDRIAGMADASGVPARVALRLAPDLGPGRLETRFGFSPPAALAALERHAETGAGSGLEIAGLHFHLDGYAASDRVLAIAESLEVVDALRERGHDPAYIDIGGGVPMSYLDDEAEWDRFWHQQRRALSGERDPLTFEGHSLGQVYPYHQQPTRGAWLEQVLGSWVAPELSVAGALRARGLRLRCEPGRSLLDGCGMTLARVEFRKQRRDGTWLVGLAMNRTQCRSTSDDFMVDPLLIRAGEGKRTPAIEAYLVGAYCIERELITWRRMSFPEGVGVGDVIAFPNTAGYLMHILESSSHQIPLARNVVLGGDGAAVLDDIDS